MSDREVAEPWSRPDWVTLAVCLFLAALVIELRQDAFGFFEDEGNNLLKAMMLGAGHDLYREVYSDQAPLFTWILLPFGLGLGWRYEAVRQVSAGFGVALLAGAFALARQLAGPVAGAVTVGSLLLLAPVQKFAGAVVIATPALALSAWALFAAFTAGARGSVRLAALAGLLLGLAGATKLAFLYFAPIALLALLYPRAPDDNRPARCRRMAAWAGAALLPLVAGLATSPGSGGLAQLFGPHLAALGLFERQAAAARRFMLLSPGFPALYLAAALAIGLLVVRHRRARVLALWLGTVAAWMLTYRPLWSHHLPDLLLPLAVLLGAGAVAWARVARRLALERRWLKAGLAAVVPLAPLIAGLTAHVRSYDGWRFYYDNTSVGELARVAEVVAGASSPSSSSSSTGP